MYCVLVTVLSLILCSIFVTTAPTVTDGNALVSIKYFSKFYSFVYFIKETVNIIDAFIFLSNDKE